MTSEYVRFAALELTSNPRLHCPVAGAPGSIQELPDSAPPRDRRGLSLAQAHREGLTPNKRKAYSLRMNVRAGGLAREWDGPLFSAGL
jgi:hypothetical protein